MTRLVDALLVCPNAKTVTNLYRQITGDPDPKTAADFFRKSTWSVAAVASPRKQFMVLSLLAAAKALHLDVPLLISIDDSLGKKDPATRHLEAVDFHHNHSQKLILTRLITLKHEKSNRECVIPIIITH